MPVAVTVLQYLKQFLNCSLKSLRVLLTSNPLAKFSPAFFAFASQGEPPNRSLRV